MNNDDYDAADIAASELYPADYTAHWTTGPANVCEKHLKQINGLARLLGVIVSVNIAPHGSQCKNCLLEAEATT